MTTEPKPRVGDSVYRVVEDIENDTWQVMARNVIAVTPQCIRLDRPFPGCAGTTGLMTFSRIGRVVFLTPAEAVEDFIAMSRRNREEAQRQLATCKKALAWSASAAAQVVVRRKLGKAVLRIEETGGSVRGRPEYEIFAPDGYNFGGPHSLVQRCSRKEALADAQTHPLERCEADCECRA